MTRSLLILAAAVGTAVAASTVGAHHSHIYFYDQCRSLTVEARVESVDWKDPHTLIVVRSDDGQAYTVDWIGLTAMTNRGIVGPAKAALVVGARIAIAGHPIRTTAEIREHFPDYPREVNPNTVDPTLIRRVNDDWSWAVQNPPDCAAR